MLALSVPDYLVTAINHIKNVIENYLLGTGTTKSFSPSLKTGNLAAPFKYSVELSFVPIVLLGLTQLSLLNILPMNLR